jgi:hypothetical protein
MKPTSTASDREAVDTETGDVVFDVKHQLFRRRQHCRCAIEESIQVRALASDYHSTLKLKLKLL